MEKFPPVQQLKGRTLGRILIKMGLLTRDKVHQCLNIQKKRGGNIKLGQVFLDLELITREQLRIALAGQRGMEYVDVSGIAIPSEVIEQVSAQMAKTYKIVPIEFEKSRKELVVAVESPDNFRATDDLRTLTGYEVRAKVTEPDMLKTALDQYYPEEDESINELIGEIESDGELKEFQGRDASIDLEELKELAESNPIKKLLNLVLLQAIRDKASDVHFEPFEDEFKMRYRIDGVLYDMVPPPKHVAVAVSSRIKVMANLDIAERRLPQDGRIPLVVGGKPIDLRVSVLPTMFGESVVLRILDRSQVELRLDMLGLRKNDLEKFEQLIKKPNGILIVTGPTGCGKTTTLYSALKELNTVETKIITTEDPVEYDIDGLVQCQMNSDIGLTFARCLRHILRQDPDVIMIGEVRDEETAATAIQSSLTGHLVFSTLHTNDSAGAVSRLLDFGVEPYLVSSSLLGIMAQRLLRRICPDCKQPYQPSVNELRELGIGQNLPENIKFYIGAGCEKCFDTGYRGRIGIYELMIIDEQLREMIYQKESAGAIKKKAISLGLQTLRMDGARKVAQGITSIAEVLRVTQADTM